MIRFFSCLFVLVAAGPMQALPLPAPLFGDHAVLQHGAKTPVWGTAAPKENIRVSFNEHTATTVADSDGRWSIDFVDLPCGERGELRVVGDTGSHVSNDVLAGDVWLCAGQSNMEWNLGRLKNAEEVKAAANHPGIRQFLVEARRNGSLAGSWRVCTPESAAVFTAVGYFFAREISEARQTPVGLINASEGGTPIEAWTNPQVLTEAPRFRVVTERWQTILADYPEKQRTYEAALVEWKKRKSNAEANKEAFSEREPIPPPGTGHKSEPSRNFNRMIKPLVPVALKGILWYQGEHNAARHSEYAELFQSLIHDWRHLWKSESLPFLYVQLPNVTEAPGKSDWPGLRQAQAATEAPPHTAMAVTIDVGDPNDVHPRDKEPVGHRLALLARKNVYGEDIVATGPRLAHGKRDGSKARLTFRTENGSSLSLRSKTSPKVAFELAAEDGRFFPAEALLEGNEVVLHSREVSVPKRVRYLWKSDPYTIVYDEHGLPAPPFEIVLP